MLIPIFTETIVDDNFNTSSQIDVAVNLIYNLCSTYSIDTDRLYTTGQSMGGMTSFHFERNDCGRRSLRQRTPDVL
ncbi:MAG: hypothetical protein MSA26_15545 [Lachnospiraceae bacterium]|nr:hypothetical protein [Lachnospiraceae bacterium]